MFVSHLYLLWQTAVCQGISREWLCGKVRIGGRDGDVATHQPASAKPSRHTRRCFQDSITYFNTAAIFFQVGGSCAKANMINLPLSDGS